MRRAAAGDGSAVIVLHQGSVEPPHGWYKSLLITAVHVPAAVSAWLFTTCVLLGLSSTCATDESTTHSARECGQPLASVQQWAPLLCSCAVGVCLIIWLIFARRVLWAHARTQIMKNQSPSAMGAVMATAYAKQPHLTLITTFLLLQWLIRGMFGELREYASSAPGTWGDIKTWPFKNAFEGLGAEVLVVCQIIGALLEEKAFRDAAATKLHTAPLSVIHMVVRVGSFEPLPGWAMCILAGSWEIVLCAEWYDETTEPPSLNPNRQQARAAALLGLVKTISDVFVFTHELPRMIW